jgi:putative multiple sugar transport system substrate-binding protein
MEIFAGSLDEVNAFWYHEEAMKVLQPFIDSGQLVVKSGQIDIKTVTIPGWAAEKHLQEWRILLLPTIQMEPNWMWS